MMTNAQFTPMARALLIAASLVIVLAGLKATAPILTPIILATFFSIILSSIFYWLKRKKLSTWLALLIMIVSVPVIGLLLIGLITISINQFVERSAAYEITLKIRLADLEATLRALLASLGLDLSNFQLPELFDPGTIVQSVASLIAGFGATLANSVLLLLIIIFMIIESANLPAKLEAGLGTDNVILTKFNEFSTGIKSYVLMRTHTNLFTGVAVGIMLRLIGVEFAFLWGLLAFFLSYIPYIGLVLAAIPAVLLAWLQFGLTMALIVIAGYVLFNILAENVVSPKLMGQGLKLSILIVFLSLIFWGWLFGFVGTILAAPLTVLVKIILDSSDETRWIAIVLGSDVPVISDTVTAEKSGT